MYDKIIGLSLLDLRFRLHLVFQAQGNVSKQAKPKATKMMKIRFETLITYLNLLLTVYNRITCFFFATGNVFELSVLSIFLTRVGCCKWRDSEKPREILAKLCKKDGIPKPVYKEGVCEIGGRKFVASKSYKDERGRFFIIVTKECELFSFFFVTS